MNGIAWIILGVLALAFSAFAIPYGFNQQAKKDNKPTQEGAISTKTQIKDSTVGGDIVSGDKITQNIILPTNDTPESPPVPKEPPDKKQTIQVVKPIGSDKTSDNCPNLDTILSEYAGKDYFIYSKEHDEFGFRIFGNFDNLLNIEILFRYTNGLHYVSEGELENIFYPLINFGELIGITNEIREDKLGIRLKCHYLNAKNKSGIRSITKEVIENAFYQFAQIPKESCLYPEIYNKSRHPIKPEWPWPYDWKP